MFIATRRNHRYKLTEKPLSYSNILSASEMRPIVRTDPSLAGPILSLDVTQRIADF